MTLNILQGNPQIPSVCPICGANFYLATKCPKCGRIFVPEPKQTETGSRAGWRVWAVCAAILLTIVGAAFWLRQAEKPIIPVPPAPVVVAEDPPSQPPAASPSSDGAKSGSVKQPRRSKSSKGRKRRIKKG
jgi:hypothetical protein